MSRILLVDDEPHVLKAVGRLLNDHDVVGCTGAEEALQRARNESFDLVLSDYRMPEMDGVEFLRRFMRLQPDAARLMLTAHADLEGVQAAINDAAVFRFINKPWSDFELRNAVDTALAHQAVLLENQRLADLVREQQAQLEQQGAVLRALEEQEPGITRVERDADGSISVDEGDTT